MNVIENIKELETNYIEEFFPNATLRKGTNPFCLKLKDGTRILCSEDEGINSFGGMILIEENGNEIYLTEDDIEKVSGYLIKNMFKNRKSQSVIQILNASNGVIKNIIFTDNEGYNIGYILIEKNGEVEMLYPS